jgi:hypothetical protein
MKNIAVVLAHQKYFKYIYLDSFSDLEKSYNVTYVINKNLLKFFKVKKKFFSYENNESEKKIYEKFILYSMSRNRFKSKTFLFKTKEYFPGLCQFIKNNIFEKYFKLEINPPYFYFIYLIFKYFLSRSFLNFFINSLFQFDVIYNWYNKNIINKHLINSKLNNILVNIKPELLIYPTNFSEPEIFDIAKVKNKIKAKTLFLMDSWDNISSKTIILHPPDALTVWGEQTKKHAIDLQNIRTNKVYILGDPKFDRFFQIRNKKVKNIYNFPYVIFVGSLRYFNEIAVLKMLEKEIEDNKNLYKNLKIIYRPHPGFENKFTEALKCNFRNIILDTQLFEFYRKNKSYIKNNYNYYFEKLLGNSLFCIGGNSTMILESLIFRKEYIFLCHKENFNPSSPDLIYKFFNHLHGIKKISGLIELKNIKDLTNIFRKIYKKKTKTNITQNNFDNQINFFYSTKNFNYSLKLANIVKKIKF